MLPFALVLVVLLVGAGLAFLMLVLHPEWAGVVSAFRGHPDPKILQGLAIVVLAAGLWGAFAFWQGTHYSRLSCVQVDRVAEALDGVDLSIQVWTRSVGGLSDKLDAMRSAIRVRTDTTAEGGP